MLVGVLSGHHQKYGRGHSPRPSPIGRLPEALKNFLRQSATSDYGTVRQKEPAAPVKTVEEHDEAGALM